MYKYKRQHNLHESVILDRQIPIILANIFQHVSLLKWRDNGPIIQLAV